MSFRLKLLALSISMVFASQPVAVLADEEEEAFEEDLEDFYGDEEFVSIATGTKKAIHKAPAVTSVVTAEEIRDMGARNLSEVLETIPGLHVSRSGQNFAPEFWFRGITSTFNPQTLFMVNGISQKSVVRGDSHTVWGEFPVHSIERIEIIRGPGSALYGADAFSGVINVITKSLDKNRKGEVGLGVGEYGTQNLWFNTQNEIGEFKFAYNFEFLKSDGFEGIVESDAQSIIDAAAAGFNIPPASLAPGYLSTGYESMEFWLTAEGESLRIDFGIQDRSNVGMGQGATEALDSEGRLGSYKHNLKVSLKEFDISENTKLSSAFSYYGSSQEVESNLLLFPRGAFFGAFPDGFIGNPGWEERTTRLQVDLSYQGFENSQVRYGLGFENQDLYKVTESKNFNPDFTPRPGGLADVSDTPEIYIPEADRNSKFLYGQVVSQLAPDWELTAGARYDDYSDFGSTFNPRVALVWSTSLKLTTKFLYGRAFRAPAFAETLVVNNPVALGNPSLEPETIDTIEIAFIYKYSPELNLDVNLFNYKIEDFITFVPDANGLTATAQNLGERSGKGIEASMNYKVSNDLRIKSNLSYIDAQDDLVNDDVGDYPNFQTYLALNWSLTESFGLNIKGNYVGARLRVPGDSRLELPSYLSLDLSLRYKINENSTLNLIMTNLNDDDVREPSSAGRTLGQINMPNDLPQAGRMTMLRYNYSF